MDEKGKEACKERAKLAEQAERFDDMAESMKELIEYTSSHKKSPDQSERNLLSVAYKNVVGARRSSWRVVNANVIKYETTKDKPGHKEKYEIAKNYKDKLEKELDDICKTVLDIIDEKVIPFTQNSDTPSESNVRHADDTFVFFLKMKGDYLRYQAEYISDKDAKKDVIKRANEAYKQAEERANQLPSTHPNRLGLALNYSVFFYEIMSEPEQACTKAKQAFDFAIADLDQLDSDDYKDSTLIMQLLRDNLTLWTSDQEQEQEQQECDGNEH